MPARRQNPEAVTDRTSNSGFRDALGSARPTAPEIHFFTHPELRSEASHAGCYVRVADADAVFSAFRAAALPRQGIPRLDDIGDKPWGMREFAVVDEDGNLIRVGRAL